MPRGIQRSRQFAVLFFNLNKIRRQWSQTCLLQNDKQDKNNFIITLLAIIIIIIIVVVNVIMAQLPDPDKHLLRALSQFLGLSISGAPPPRSIQTLIHTCRKKDTPFPKQIPTDIQYTVPVNSAIVSRKILKHRKVKLERCVNKTR